MAGRIWPLGCSLLIPDVEERKQGGKRDALRRLVITFILGSGRGEATKFTLWRKAPVLLGEDLIGLLVAEGLKKSLTALHNEKGV